MIAGSKSREGKRAGHLVGAVEGRGEILFPPRIIHSNLLW